MDSVAISRAISALPLTVENLQAVIASVGCMADALSQDLNIGGVEDVHACLVEAYSKCDDIRALTTDEERSEQNREDAADWASERDRQEA